MGIEYIQRPGLIMLTLAATRSSAVLKPDKVFSGLVFGARWIVSRARLFFPPPQIKTVWLARLLDGWYDFYGGTISCLAKLSCWLAYAIIPLL